MHVNDEISPEDLKFIEEMGIVGELKRPKYYRPYAERAPCLRGIWPKSVRNTTVKNCKFYGSASEKCYYDFYYRQKIYKKSFNYYKKRNIDMKHGHNLKKNFWDKPYKNWLFYQPKNILKFKKGIMPL